MYLKYFGLREAPFNLTPDSKFFYNSAFHREALASLFYGIKSKKGFLVVTGEIGTGKTTLIRKLLRSLEATHHSVFIFNTLVTFEELLENIMQDLGLDHAGLSRVAVIHRLNDFLLDKANQGHTVSILIDEAQNLSENALEAVRLLSNMETDREKLIQIILVGQPELEAKLNSHSLRQLKQRVSLWSRLDRLSPTDTETYIHHRLEVAGYEGPDIFDSSSIRLICEYASGTPRLINSICDNALLTAFADSKKVVSEQIVHDVVRDLRLKPQSEVADFVSPEHRGVGQPTPKALRNVSELGDAKVRWPDEPDRSRMARHTPAPAPAGPEVVYNFGLKWAPAAEVDGVQSEREIKRQPARIVSSVVELREKRNQDRERIVEADETSGIHVASGKGDFIAPRYRSTRQRADDALVSPSFFAKMIQILTEAMGPMASLVLKEQIAGLGESPEEFPIIRLPDLMESIKQEILSEGLRLRFEEEIAKQIQEHSKPAAWRSSAL